MKLADFECDCDRAIDVFVASPNLAVTIAPSSDFDLLYSRRANAASEGQLAAYLTLAGAWAIGSRSGALSDTTAAWSASQRATQRHCRAPLADQAAQEGSLAESSSVPTGVVPFV